MKYAIAILVLSLMHGLNAEDRVHRHNELKDWNNINNLVSQYNSDTKLVYEYFDIHRDVFIKIYKDNNNERALIVYWPSDSNPVCQIDGVHVEGHQLFEPFYVNTYAFLHHYASDGTFTVKEERSRIIHYRVGSWISKPSSGSRGFEVTHNDTKFKVSWNSVDELPRTHLNTDEK